VEKKNGKRFARGAVFGFVLVVVIGIVLFVPFIPVDVTYTETESYERPARYDVTSATTTEEWDWARGIYHTIRVTVKNTDSKGGTFKVTLSLYDVHGLFGEKTVNNYIAPGASAVFKAEFDTVLGQDVRGEYSISEPTVIDERLVTRHRTVYKSIIQMLFSRT